MNFQSGFDRSEKDETCILEEKFSWVLVLVSIEELSPGGDLKTKATGVGVELGGDG